MRPNLERRSVRARLALASRILAAALLTAALVLEHRRPVWVFAALVIGLALIALSWRRKGPMVPGSLYATSADLISNGTRPRQYPGELSVTPTRLVWNPSPYSLSHGLEPISITGAECAGIRTERGAALLDVIVSAQRVGGEETRFLTHWRPGLPRAIARLRGAIEPTAVEDS